MKHAHAKLVLGLLLSSALACNLGGLASPAGPTEASQPAATQSPISALPSPTSAAPTGPAVLLFTIGVHIEPLGATPSEIVGGGPPATGGGQGVSYERPQTFARHAADLLTVAEIVERHGGRMTVQAQTPFTVVALETGNTILADLAARGHEIGLHFHEDAHLGRNAESLPVETWCAVMQEEIGFIQQASGATSIRYWSGGNLYPDLYAAATCAGLDVNSDWKNPRLQETPLELVGVNPWRPAGGTDGVDLSAFTTHDPDGAVVFIPEGQYDRTDFAAMRRSESAGGDEAYFEYLKTQLNASLQVATPGKVNVFHFTVHPGEFRGGPQQPFAVIENFLTDAVDPLIAAGQVQWASLSEMADAFTAWEAANPGAAP